MTSPVHSSLVKIAVDPDGAAVQIIIECTTCGRIYLLLPVTHLATLARACATAAEQLGVSGITEKIAQIEAPTESALDAVLNDIRQKARWN